MHNPREVHVTLSIIVISDQEGPVTSLNDDDLLNIAEALNTLTSHELAEMVKSVEDKGEV